MSISLELIVKKWDVVFSSFTQELVDALIFSNLDKSNSFHRHLLNDIYVSRVYHIPEVKIGRLPDVAIIRGDGEFSVIVDGNFVTEQSHPVLWNSGPVRGGSLRNQDVERVEVAKEVLLIARYGHQTWGHWLIELLPKIVLAEFKYPKRFLYAVHAETLNPDTDSSVFKNIRGSIEAYGIAFDRFIPLDPYKNYQIKNLWCTNELSSADRNSTFHPDLLKLMNLRMPRFNRCTYEKVAFLRTESVGRNIENLQAVSSELENRGFEIIEIGKKTFGEQVEIFRCASQIVSILGSSLSGLLYSRSGVRVMSLAPPKFGDRFFYLLMQNKNAKYIDIRGDSKMQIGVVDRDDIFSIEITTLRQALDFLDSYPTHF